MTSTQLRPALSQSEAGSTSQPGSSANKRLDLLVLLAVIVKCAVVFSLPLRSHGLLMGFAQDDFFYYLKAAQSLAAGHGATFDGVTHTNGYHPLYFLLWTLVSFFTGNLRSVFRLLWVLDVVSGTVIFLCARRVFRRITANKLLSNAFALAVLVPCIATICFQMEVTLALPLAFAFLATGFVPAERYTTGRCLLLGLLGALTMLARLDAGIVVFLFLLGLLLVRGMRPVFTGSNMVSFSAAALPPLLVYLAINRHYFHEWLPISGTAKQMRHGWMPDLLQMQYSFHGFSLLFLLITGISCVAAVRMRARLAPQEKVLCVAALLMPLLFYALEMIISAWKLWGWYLYALRFPLLVAGALLLIVFTRTPVWQPLQRLTATAWFAPVLLLLALLVLTRTHYKVDPVMMAIADEDTRLNEFAKTHPGRYAMGDRSGMFGYTSSSPVLQAEGLMMDRHYLQHIRREDDLLSTFNQYHVDYFVQFVQDEDLSKRLVGGCLRAQEPSIAGKDALRMRSTICSPPLAVLPGYDGGRLFIYHLPIAS